MHSLCGVGEESDDCESAFGFVVRGPIFDVGDACEDGLDGGIMCARRFLMDIVSDCLDAKGVERGDSECVAWHLMVDGAQLITFQLRTTALVIAVPGEGAVRDIRSRRAAEPDVAIVSLHKQRGAG